MNRMINKNKAPRKIRVTVFINGDGFTTSRYMKNYDRESWQVELYNLRTRGFYPLATFNIPFRYWFNGQGFDPVYRYFVNRYVYQIGL